MNPLVKMAFRFLRLTLLSVAALAISFMICAVGLLHLQERVDGLNAISPRTLVLSTGGMLTILFGCAYGWLVGKPLVYFISWINRLSKGNYTEPGKHYRNKPDGAAGKSAFRYPYALYKELLQQMSQLTEQLYHSETERLNLEAKKQEWIASISHDLKTPLSYVEGYAHLLTASEYRWTDAEKLDFSRQISSKAAEMKQLIQELKQTSRWQARQFPMHLQRANVVDFLRDTVIDIANHPVAEHTLFTFTASEPVKLMEFDGKLLGRAVQNVLMNAVIHNPPGTEVTVDLSFGENGCLLVIEDDGVGIDKEVLQQAMYHSGKGMAIARAFIEAHSGVMNIVEADGGGTGGKGGTGGTRVEITLPG